MEIVDPRKAITAFVLLAQLYRQEAESKAQLGAVVNVLNAVATVLNTNQHDLGTRLQAVQNLYKRAHNVTRDKHRSSEDRLKEMRRIAVELAGLLANHNKENEHHKISELLINELRQA